MVRNLCGRSSPAERQAIEEIEAGKEDANLGGGVYKQRVARQGAGKSGGFRTIVPFKSGLRSVFAYGFAKNERDNITPVEPAAFKKLANEYLNLDEDVIERLLAEGKLTEIIDDADEENDEE